MASTKQRFSKSIKLKLYVLFVSLSLIPLLAIGFILYEQKTAAFSEFIQDSLFSLVKSKESKLEDYINNTIALGHSIAKTDVMQKFISYGNKSLQATIFPEYETVKKDVENLIYSFQETHWGKYHHIFFIDKSGKIAISPNRGFNEKGSPSSHLNESTTLNPWAMTALRGGQIAVSDYSSWVESDHNHQMLFIPVKDLDNEVQGVLGFELQIPYIIDLLYKGAELGETGKIFLITNKGVPIVYKGFQGGDPLNIDGLNSLNNGEIISDIRNNSQGVEVIDLYLKHEKYPWILVAEIETSEVFAALRKVQKVMLISILLTLVIVSILAVLFSDFIINPIKNLTDKMEMISYGKFDLQSIDHSREDEIGSLINAFNRILVSLKILIKRKKTLKNKV